MKNILRIVLSLSIYFTMTSAMAQGFNNNDQSMDKLHNAIDQLKQEKFDKSSVTIKELENMDTEKQVELFSEYQNEVTEYYKILDDIANQFRNIMEGDSNMNPLFVEGYKGLISKFYAYNLEGILQRSNQMHFLLAYWKHSEIFFYEHFNEKLAEIELVQNLAHKNYQDMVDTSY